MSDGPAFRVRPADRSDLLAVARVESSSFDEPWPVGAFVDFLDDAVFLVAADGRAVFGFVVADVPGAGVGHVKDLAVAPAHREGGVGRRLLEAALDRLRERRVAAVRLEVRASNDPAVELYRSAGFRVARRRAGYYTDGEDALVMVWAAGGES